MIINSNLLRSFATAYSTKDVLDTILDNVSQGFLFKKYQFILPTEL